MAKEKKRNFSRAQYEMLKRCSDAKDITEWNQWRIYHASEDVLLERAPMSGFWLEGACLGGVLWDEWREAHVFGGLIYLQRADLKNADLTMAGLMGVNLQGANLANAKLINADLRGADLKGADIQGADFKGANLKRAKI